MPTTQVKIETGQGAMPLSVAEPRHRSRRAVVVLHAAVGITPHTQQWLEHVAADGYLAVAPHLLYREGVDTINPMERFDNDTAKFAAWLPNDEALLVDIGAVLRHLTEKEGYAAGSIGFVGFSYGGRAAFLTAVSFEVGACVSWYANGIGSWSYAPNEGLRPLLDRPLKTPWLGLMGEEDFLFSETELDDLRAALSSQAVPHELVAYPGAAHGFDIEATQPGWPPTYDEHAATDAAARTKAYFLDNLGRQ